MEKVEGRVVIALQGYPCTGKTTLARALAKDLKWPVISLEDIRDSILSVEGYKMADFRQVPETKKMLCYQVAWGMVRTQLVSKHSVVVDSPLLDHENINRVAYLAYRNDAALIVVECKAPNQSKWESWLKDRVAGESNSGWYELSSTEHLSSQVKEKYGDLMLEFVVPGIPKIAVDMTSPVEIEEHVSTVKQFIASDFDLHRSSFREMIDLTIREAAARSGAEERAEERYEDGEWEYTKVGKEKLESPEEKEIYHYCHKHDLTFSEEVTVDDKEMIRCNLCLQPISAPIYSCSNCSYFLHKSCAELRLPDLIDADIHGSSDPLILVKSPKIFNCSVCRLPTKEIIYGCTTKGCSFVAHIACALLPHRFVPEDGHKHPLSYSALPNQQFVCTACGDSVKDTFYKCFNLEADPCRDVFHINCGLLPRFVRHEVQPKKCWFRLIFAYEKKEVFCDVCETEVDTDHWAYYCAKCDIMSHLRCAISDDIWDSRIASYHAYEMLACVNEDDEPNTSTSEQI
ncbi:hypothetical protein RJ641_020399 [Dillenia turbinata]|uniref:DC1 domain-containing protein n=1 Tax=Dillenia turbinata TaxID=194707 RepID=A0AAN8UTN7_9MAGN